MLDFDDVFKEISEFGRYQKLMVFSLTVPGCIMNAYSFFTVLFLTYTPPHVCKVPENITIGNWTAEKCTLQSSDPNNPNSSCLYGWAYDHKYFESTVVTQWNLVCNKALEVNILISMLGIASVIGAILFAWIQDRYGRKLAFLLCNAAYIAGSLPTPLCPSLICFTSLRCVSALTAIASWNVCYTWVLELVGPSKRTLVSTIFCLMYALATSSIGLIAYLCSNWVKLTLATTAPFILIFSYYWTMSESPRWLLSQGRNIEALSIVEKIAKWEGKSVSADLTSKLLAKTTDISIENQSKSCWTVFREQLKFTELFRRSNLRKKTILITMSNIACVIIYTSIAYNIENLGGNLYATYVIQAAMEAPATLVNLVTLDRVGRVIPLSLGMFLTGFACLSTAPGDLLADYVIIILAAIGKFGISLSYDTLCQLGSELYPTPVRGVGIGFSSVVADIGGILMPYIILSAQSYRMMPMIILGSMAIVCGVSALFLPETVTLPMAETLEEAEVYGISGSVAFRDNIKRLKCCPRGKNENKPAVVHPELCLSSL